LGPTALPAAYAPLLNLEVMIEHEVSIIDHARASRHRLAAACRMFWRVPRSLAAVA